MRHTAIRLVMALGLALLAGCGGSSSPTAASDASVVVVESESLVSVSGGACHVQGTLVNTAEVGVFDVVLRWEAFDAAGTSLGTTRVTITALRPGERRTYDATGFAGNSQGLVPCSKIARFDRLETTVTNH